MRDMTTGIGPHAGQPIAVAGSTLKEAAGALILLHGRGGSAEEMLGVAEVMASPRTAWLAPQAARHTWYPHRFVEPVEVNEPYLGSALSIVGELLDRIIAGGIPPERIALLGFSQGACLALEFTRRRAQPINAVIGLSGGLIGDTLAPAPAGVRPLLGMPVLLASSERDPHIPIGRVRETDAIMRALGAEVVTRVYPGDGHGINDDEIKLTSQILGRMAGALPGAV